jgi:hypothetical protein
MISVAYSKSIIVLFFLLKNIIAFDGCSQVGKFENEKGAFSLAWCFPSSDEIQLTFSINGTSFIALGFGGSMYDADMIIGWVDSANTPVANDYYSSAEAEPQQDVKLGGENNVKVLSGSRSGTVTTLMVSRKLSTGDKYDRDIRASGPNDMIYAWGSSNDQGLVYHGDNHNHIHVDFSKPDGIPDTSFGYEESGRLSRELVKNAYYATLSTWQSEAAGAANSANFPYGSVADLADDGHGQPLVLLSNLERSVINFMTYPSCSLHFISSANTTLELRHPEYYDVMTKPRTTLLGRLVPVPSEELEVAREIYLRKHPTAKAWITFSDFILYKMQIEDIYVVGGFGNEHYIGWISPSQYLSCA